VPPAVARTRACAHRVLRALPVSPPSATFSLTHSLTHSQQLPYHCSECSQCHCVVVCNDTIVE
jgi:hypothetical protein